ncbi:MAG: TolC family outer membrane protein [Holosporaceae bacterium]|jgi:outer membrane protein|nr:TolC family outer membrane protein [Holosporaceae bacterium]
MKKLSILILVFVTVLVVEAKVKTEDLFDILHYVNTHSPRLQAKRAELRSIDTLKLQAQTGYLPRVDLTANISPEHRDYKTQFLNNNMNDNVMAHSFGVDARINLYEGGKTDGTVKIANYKKITAEFSLIVEEQNIYLQAVQAYILCLDAMEVLQLKINNRRILEAYCSKCKNQVSLGRGTQTDVAQAEARLSGAISQVTEAETELDNAKEQFCAIVGKFPENLTEIPFEKITPLIPASVDECEKFALKANPLILHLEIMEKIAMENRNISGSGMSPSVNARVFVGRQLKQPMISRMNRYQAELSVSIPIYDGDLAYYKTIAAEHNITMALCDIEDARRHTIKATRIALNEIRKYKSEIQSAQDQVKANERALAGVQDEAQNGSRTTLDLLNAEQELLDSKVKLTRARHGLIISYFKALHAMGKLGLK